MTDIPADVSTTAFLNFDGQNSTSFNGFFEANLSGDQDFIRFFVSTTTDVQFYLSMQGIGSSSVANPQVSLFDGNGGFIDTDFDSGVGGNALLLRNLAPGTYFVAPAAFNGQTAGAYSLFVTTNRLTDQLLTTGDDVRSGNLPGGRYLGGFGDDIIDLSGTTFSSIDALGEEGDDTLTGNAFVNVLSGGTGGDSLDGRAGNDILFGDQGDDSLLGGTDNDRLYGGDGRDLLNGGSGNDILRGDDGEDVLFGGDNDDQMDGGAGDDFLFGEAGTDELNGGDGNDTLDGGAGSDFYTVDAGDIIVETAGNGIDVVSARTSFVLAADDDIERLQTTNTFGTQAINLTGNGLAQEIFGNAGNNILDGGAAGFDGVNDNLFGFDGNDTYVLGNGRDTVFDTSGIDTITSTITRSLLTFSGIENITLVGTGSFSAIGSNGANVLIGNSATNRLTGGEGKDTLTGGGGRDFFDYNRTTESRTTSRDLIKDFARKSDDIDLSTIDASTRAGGDQAFTFIGSAAFSRTAGELHAIRVGSLIRVEGDTNGDGRADFAIDVMGTAPLVAGDFIL
ncbi:MAG: calcium-binding protein [Hyphomicrobiaceae bacterium]|nr:calcium-binding protein [Hyphomicrobiaceae bacterium]